MPPYTPLIIDNVALQEKRTEVYLGLRMDSHLTWNTQIEHIKSKLSSLAGSLRNIVRCVPRQIRFTIYNSLVKSHLLYLMEVWGGAAKTTLSKLQILQNKIIKILFNYPYLTSSSTIYQETKFMNIKQLYNYSTCILVRKILHKSIHTNLAFTKIKQLPTRTRSTRRASFLVLPKIRTNYGRTTIVYDGAQLYNKLPPEIKSVGSFNVFKTKLADYILSDTSLLSK